MVADAHQHSGSGAVLVGRGAELERIADALESAKRATPSTLLIEGTPGIGKTSLLDVACELAHERGFVVCRAKGSLMEREMPFAVVQQLFERLLRGQDGGAAPEGYDLVSRHLTADAGENSEFQAHRSTRDLFRFTAEFARHAPLCLAVDDVQWADVQSLHWLNYLVHRVVKLPVVILVTRTPGVLATDPLLIAELEIHSERMKLAFFTASDVARLTERMLGRTPDEKFTQAFVDATGGCPTVTRHILGVMRERSVPPEADVANDLLRPECEKLGQSLLARLNHQSPELVELAKVVAVVEPSDLALLAAVLDINDGEATQRVRQLEGMGVLTPDGELAFAHPVIKNTIGSAIGYREREELHARAARFLHDTRAPAPVVARHVLRTPSPTGAWAVEALRTAAATAIAEGDARFGAQLLTRALDEDLPVAQRQDLLLRLGLAETFFDPRMAAAHLEEGMIGLDDPREALAAACRLTEILYFEGAYDSASKVLHQVVSEIEPKFPAAVEVVRLQERITVPAPAPESGQVDFRQFDELQWRRGDELGRRLAGLIAEDTSNRGEELALCRKAALAALSGGATSVLQHPQRMFGVLNALLRADEAELVLRHCDEILLEAHRQELSLIALIGHSLRSRAHHHQGSFTEAGADAELALSAARTAKLPTDHLGHVYATDAWVRARLALGELDAARDALAPFDRSANLPRTWHHTALLHARGAVRMELGDNEGALADQLECGERFESWGRPNPAVRPWRSYAALAHLRLGQPQPALDLALRELTLARQWGAPTAIGRALLTVGVATGGTAATPWLTEADSVLRRSTARMLHARVLLELAAARWEKGQHDLARNHLAEAQELGRQCGVDVRPDQRLAGLAPATTPHAPVPHHPAPTNAAPPAARLSALALTPHELRVATLVLEGNSNDEIAHRLTVSRRTVEFHLTNIYRKLGVRRRTQLSSALAGLVPRP
ncbi:LuxR family transcriptional regulator [Lentzea albida]|uniref:Predicted ATPase n=1 Tax=Lentzea albida TaxID=65499 RepID=A0A1H9MF99_9PSEU|nr:LuxR family transcriptional regulator [Lentzea albida]SER22376.1 Predicted ATPase [Lentzea albida]